MSSQGSSSVRVFSGTAFVPMSSDPLYREVSEPSTSSIESTPEVSSRPVDKGAMEPMQRLRPYQVAKAMKKWRK